MSAVFGAENIPSHAQKFIQENNLEYHFKYQLSNFIKPNTNKRQSARVANRKLTTDELTQFKESIFETCLGGIGDEYFYHVIDSVIMNIYNSKYDIVILCVKDESSDQNIYDRIAGFLVTEIGECQLEKYNKIPALNLICSNSKKIK